MRLSPRPHRRDGPLRDGLLLRLRGVNLVLERIETPTRFDGQTLLILKTLRA